MDNIILIKLCLTAQNNWRHRLSKFTAVRMEKLQHEITDMNFDKQQGSFSNTQSDPTIQLHSAPVL